MPLRKLHELERENQFKGLNYYLSKLSIQSVYVHIPYIIRMRLKSCAYTNTLICSMLSVAYVASVRARQMYFTLGMHEFKNEDALICSIVEMHEYLHQYRMHECNGEGALICNIVEIYCSYLMPYATCITVQQ